MKIGLEARLKCKVESDWKIMQWITELAGELLSGGQVGKDVQQRTSECMQEQRQDCPGDRRAGGGQTLEGLQIPVVVVFEGCWVFATRVGIDATTNEHVVVIGEEAAAIRVRTVLRRPASDRWNVDAVKAMQASPCVPNPENVRQAKVMPGCLPKKTEVEGDSSKLQEQVRRFQEFMFRQFKITKDILEKCGLSDNCKGCEAAASGTDGRRHTDDCRQRL